MIINSSKAHAAVGVIAIFIDFVNLSMSVQVISSHNIGLPFFGIMSLSASFKMKR